MKKAFFILAAGFVLASCSEKAGGKDGQENGKEIILSDYDWDEMAARAQETLETDFWYADENFYWIDNIHDVSTFYHYWQTAHAMETLMDAYERTGDDFYADRVRTVLARIKQSTGGKYINQYYDDMAWMGMACLRAYDLFGEDEYMIAATTLWEDVQGGWLGSDSGMLWNKIEADKDIRNACTHWTVACFAAQMYRKTGNGKDLTFALDVYKWANGNLYDSSTGGTFSSVDNRTFMTYNQGVLIGASLELYDITERKSYMDFALRCGDFCIRNDKFAKEGIWRNEGAGGDPAGSLNRNNGIFKGILTHYMTDLIRSPYLDDTRRQSYIRFMEKQGVTLYEATKDRLLFPGDWTRAAEPGERIYLGCHLSGTILMECNAVYMKEYPEMLEHTHVIHQ